MSYALISVSDKTELPALAKALVAHGYTLLSTGGSAQMLRAEGFDVRDVAEVTGFPEMMQGRVKTLHPHIHGGLLAKRNNPDHLAAMQAHGMGAIDVLVVNLYPFAATLETTHGFDALIEQIDVGGPAMIRAAAKNHADVCVLTDPADYPEFMAALAAKTLTPALRQTLAAKAFAHTASYDTLIAAWLSAQAGQTWPARLLDAQLTQPLSYGENPHQQAALYTRVSGQGGLARAEILHGKPLSFNNLQDGEAAWQIVSAPALPCAVLVKHMNPCGVAIGSTSAEAFTRALASDPQSAFGGILALNRPVDLPLVEALGSLFLEVILAPDFTPEALAQLRATKKNLRLLKLTPEHTASPLAAWQIQPVSGGYIVQTRDAQADAPETWRSVGSQEFSPALHADAALAWHVVRHVKSNAIVLVKEGRSIGIGAGQMSRVDAVRIAIQKAVQHGHDTRGSVLASDAFFPFADNVTLAAEAGVAAVIQPGGSVRDDEVIAAANNAGIAMLFTGTRHFKH